MPMRYLRVANLCTATWLLVACSAQFHPAALPQSEGHLTADRVVSSGNNADIPPPIRATDLVPPPQPATQLPTYSVVVTEVPVKELLQALARDTKQNIDIHPALSGLVSLNAINQTLPAILDRISQQIDMRYTIEGNTIIVAPDTPYTKTYKVNYINMSRDMTSTVGISGQITNTSNIAGGGTSSGGANASSTTVTTKSTNDFWKTLEDNIRGILNSTREQSRAKERQDSIKEMLSAAEYKQDAAARSNANANGVQAAAAQMTTSSLNSVEGLNALTKLLPEDVVVNPFTGTIVVNASEKQHKLVQEYLDGVSHAIGRQVLIEATIVEVDLSNTYQAGINWSRLESSGFSFTQTMLGGFGGQPLGQQLGNVMQVGYTNSANNVDATLKLLQEFGDTRVISSPKLMALNNQTALLKVVNNIVYFDVQAQQSTAGTTISTNGAATSSTALATYTTTAKTVAVGMVMGVTPQINDDGRVTLTVHPSISSVIDTVADPNPSLANPCGTGVANCNISPISNRVPEVQVREMESVLEVGSGQTVILGGLMQDSINNNRQEVPGAGLLGWFGELFRSRNDNSKKTELVIFLRPTVISNPTLDSEDLKLFQRFLPKAPATSSNTSPSTP